MSISQSVKQAIAAGAIAQSTIDELSEQTQGSTDIRALTILRDAIDNGVVTVK